MDCIAAIRFYITKMLKGAGSGMKCLVLDEETLGIISVAFSHSEVLEHEVYLMGRLSEVRERMKHLKAIVFVRPTDDNLFRLCNELRRPLYSTYYIAFSNIISKTRIKQLAEADEQEVVRDFNEFYADYFALNSNLFTFNVPRPLKSGYVWDPACLQRLTLGLGAVCLSFRKQPNIRYQGSSDVARQLAQSLNQIISQEYDLFETRSRPTLLILDRRVDATTPLLTPWTYQAMLGEMFTFENNLLKGVEEQPILLSPTFDTFFCQHLYDDYGHVMLAIKKLLEESKKAENEQAQVHTIADMKQFIANFPQFKKLKKTVLAHVKICEAIGKTVDTRSLLEVSETEQNITCGGSHGDALGRLKSLLSSGRILPKDKDVDRLVALYALRYSRHNANEIATCARQMRHPEMLAKIINYSKPPAVRTEQKIFTEVKRNIIKGLRGVENVLTQHKPLIDSIVSSWKGKTFDFGLFPAVSSSSISYTDELIVFIVGGVTYDEAMCVRNESNVIIGGTSVLNSASFIQQVMDIAES